MPQNEEKKGKPEYFSSVRQIGMLTTIPFILLLGPLIGYFLGRWIDHKWGWEPYATALFIALGFAASVRETVRILREAIRQS